MTFKSFVVAICLALSVLTAYGQAAAPGVAPSAPPAKVWIPTPQDTSAEARKAVMERFALPVDPGVDPDPTEEVIRYGTRYRIEKFDRRIARDIETRPGWTKPFPYVKFEAEIYQQNEDWVWVFVPVRIEKKEKPTASRRLPDGTEIAIYPYKQDELKLIADTKPEFEPVTVPAANKVIRFRESSEGLPKTGSWRNVADVADMNGDGFADIITPPQRAAAENEPSIFLGDGKGSWKRWEDALFPYYMSYGSVVAGDVNRDGHVDLAFGVHAFGPVVILGDGKGNFTGSSEGLPGDFPTRRVNLVDADLDGDLDLLALSEGTLGIRSMSKKPETKLRLFLNEGGGKKWVPKEIVDPGRQMGGDWMATGYVNSDKYPDIVTSSNHFNGPDIMYISGKKGEWLGFGRGFVPFFSTYSSMTLGKFSSRERDDVILAFNRTFPNNVDPEKVAPPAVESVGGIERITFDRKGNPKRVAIERWAGEDGIWGMSSGDFDGDGNLDVVYSRLSPRRFYILLGDGKGGFRKAAIEGPALPANIMYDIKVADLNRDKRPDLVVLFEENAALRDGSVRVYLNEGPALEAKP